MDESMSPWVFALQSLGQATCMIVGGSVQRVLGLRWAMITGCALLSLSTLCGYWTVNNFYLFCATYGMLFGVGVGVAYSSPMTAAMKWMPNRRGLANGLIVLGFGLGSLIFNFIETLIINPKNVKPVIDPTGVTKEKFFPKEIVEHMPKVFLILGLCYALMQLIGILLITEPNEEEQKQLVSETETSLVTTQSTKKSLTMKEAAKTSKFWEIWVTLLCASMTNIFVSSFYKFFGQSFIEDDFFLVLVGSISSVCNGLCRPFWGSMMDRFGYKKSMGSMLCLFCVFIGTFNFTKVGGKWMFMVWVCALYWCIGGVFAMIPTFTDKSFGSEYFGTIYGLVFTAVIFSSLCSAFFVTTMVKRIGVLGITM
ncbi:oxalate:formate antiporter [Blastocystis sp. subtype 4]|uniref:oxalate:formate antiporter n=1 Tax=Blastocystis sp. subtype 4 TaxID=944170 RepID=UPI0007121F5F|nr:oxalate:formate antiporter [Blastocystis sp. subtype 4]KNB43901.1 oxalate:formate antiporter [Blastocystis sp. subtype 4]|eukprot:XP_014527344.1 oxalate:formate antiporter [Blastocystis sp. subtype 4]